ncbi:hypothetical protein [Vulcaniibacterium gelatinicum]|uniref:hypothetical protein n=1 Tax=Vulcaniibacterium gelatinicum TaxID=2598725 RepID=UPI001FE56EEE|nr:hypothetical protein [Vulcaniibacterium gelatinicum]
MHRVLIGVSLWGLVAAAQAQSPADCAALAAPPALPVRPTVLPPVAPELVTPIHQLGAPSGVLAQALDEAQSVDQVLLRLKIEQCRNVASVQPAPSPAADVIDPATYKPRTQFDNTPWRFNMHQNGKRMTADEFDAWMKARGVRVARGAASAAAPAEGQAAPTPAPQAPGDEKR